MYNSNRSVHASSSGQVRPLTRRSVAGVAAFLALVVPASSQIAGSLDQVISFMQTGAAGDALTDYGNPNHYAGPGTSILGNFDSALDATFTGLWNESTVLNWAAAATLDGRNSAASTGFATSSLLLADTLILQASDGRGSYMVGVARTSQPAPSGFGTTLAGTGAIFDLYLRSLFHNQPSRLLPGVTFSTSDLYDVGSGPGSSGPPSSTAISGTFALLQGGNLAFAVGAPIPEPAAYAVSLGVAAFAAAMILRRKPARQS